MTESMYERIGGAETLRLAVQQFYEHVLRDEKLAPFFVGVDIFNLKRHQALLLADVLGAPGAKRYHGRSLAVAHADYPIDDDAFDRVRDHLTLTLHGLSVDNDIIEHVRSTVESLRDTIVSVPS